MSFALGLWTSLNVMNNTEFSKNLVQGDSSQDQRDSLISPLKWSQSKEAIQHAIKGFNVTSEAL
jgi:hypothetical protein